MHGGYKVCGSTRVTAKHCEAADQRVDLQVLEYNASDARGQKVIQAGQSPRFTVQMQMDCVCPSTPVAVSRHFFLFLNKACTNHRHLPLLVMGWN